MGIAIAVLAAMVAGLYLWQAWRQPLAPAAEGRVVALGTSVPESLARLKVAGLRHEGLFRLYLRLSGEDRRVRPGEIRLRSDWTMAQLANAMVSGPRVQYRITFIPGQRFADALRQLARAPKLRHEIRDVKQARKLLGVDHEEGQLLPETYFYQAGDSDASVLKRAHRALWVYLQKAWPQRDKGLPLKSPYEALILASIVEKETGRADERPRIAGVFIRRLQKGMRLQSDPTTIYGLGDAFDGNLTRADLRRRTPYNTYRINGLPPTPICLASRASIDAVLHPTHEDALYFVARGDGTHEFSATLEAHNRAVRRYQKKRKRAEHARQIHHP
ncbi:endolytic transglycosylase MltG [Sulfurivirga sp.]|uniref:endolytic transglycosylase MltG n=1 Tax=Sulfurivirga sp. TaxID=2614236 RepID=UPI0026001A9D|nr:endolytic transglycosylase MltG [Sulfurivirga sp.]